MSVRWVVLVREKEQKSKRDIENRDEVCDELELVEGVRSVVRLERWVLGW